jgi:hypothetical protein
MDWKILTALLLFLSVYFWCGIQIPLSGAVAFAARIAGEGQHCGDSCPHPSPLLAKQQQSNFAALLSDTCLLDIPFIAPLPPSQLARDRPPPLFFSLSHSLRAPPVLIPT